MKHLGQDLYIIQKTLETQAQPLMTLHCSMTYTTTDNPQPPSENDTHIQLTTEDLYRFINVPLELYVR